MLDFYIVTDCSERGLYRKAKQVKRICHNNIDAKLFRFQSPQDITAAQKLCAKYGISVTSREWEELTVAGRLSVFAEKGTLAPPPMQDKNDTTQNCHKNSADVLPRDAAAVIYTDGSYFPNGHHTKKGRKTDLGGWASILVLRDYFDAMVMVSGHSEKNKKIDAYYMELLAVEKALKRLKKYDISGKIILYTDCQPLVNDYNQKLAGWHECGYRKPDGTFIKFRKLWKKVWNKTRDIKERLRICWIKGHAGNPYNVHCHIVAQAEAVMRLSRKNTGTVTNTITKEAQTA